jgi:hypothetical protein
MNDDDTVQGAKLESIMVNESFIHLLMAETLIWHLSRILSSLSYVTTGKIVPGVIEGKMGLLKDETTEPSSFSSSSLQFIEPDAKCCSN